MEGKAEVLFEFLLAKGGIQPASMMRLWFDTYYDPGMSPTENMNQAEQAVNNGWHPITSLDEIAEIA